MFKKNSLNNTFIKLGIIYSKPSIKIHANDLKIKFIPLLVFFILNFDFFYLASKINDDDMPFMASS